MCLLIFLAPKKSVRRTYVSKTENMLYALKKSGRKIDVSLCWFGKGHIPYRNCFLDELVHQLPRCTMHFLAGKVRHGGCLRYWSITPFYSLGSAWWNRYTYYTLYWLIIVDIRYIEVYHSWQALKGWISNLKLCQRNQHRSQLGTPRVRWYLDGLFQNLAEISGKINVIFTPNCGINIIGYLQICPIPMYKQYII